jgi:hypothetical protein
LAKFKGLASLVDQRAGYFLEVDGERRWRGVKPCSKCICSAFIEMNRACLQVRGVSTGAHLHQATQHGPVPAGGRELGCVDKPFKVLEKLNGQIGSHTAW